MTIKPDLHPFITTHGDRSLGDPTLRADLLEFARAAQDDAARKRDIDIASTVYAEFQAVRAEIGLDPGKAWDLVNARVQTWQRRWMRLNAEAREASCGACAECGVDCPDEDLRRQEGVSRGLVCEACADAEPASDVEW